MEGLINGRTPEEIKRGLQCHVRYGNCDTECPYEDVHNEPRHECIQNMTKDALALIEHLEAQHPKWISVEERLPEAYQEVIAYTDRNGGQVEIIYFSDRIMTWCKGGGVLIPNVTHWMQIPKAPEGE